MNEGFIFVFGLFVTALAIGPLMFAILADSNDKKE